MSISPDLATPATARPAHRWAGLELLASATALVAIGLLLNNWVDAVPLWQTSGERDGPTGQEIVRWQVWSVVTVAAAAAALVLGVVRRRRLGGAGGWHLTVGVVGAAAVLLLNVTPEAPEREPVESPYGGVPCHSGSGNCGGGG